jgi:protein CpxP
MGTSNQEKRMKVLSLITVLAFLAAPLSFAAGAKMKDGRGGEFLKKELNLSDEQFAKIREIRKEHKDGLKESRKTFKESRKAFREALKGEAAKRDELTAKFDKFQKDRDAFQRKRFAMMLEMRDVLSPEQRAKFHDLKKKHRRARK